MPALNSRQQWRTQQKNTKIGDAVVVVASDTPRRQWPIGRIVEVMPGPDGNVRVVRVQVGSKVFTRSITRVCPIVEEE